MTKNEEPSVFDNAREERRRLKREWRQYRRENRFCGRGVTGGFFLIFLGVLFLLNNLGIVPWEIWNYIVGFWPIFLIFAGINVILGRNIFSRIIISVLALAAFILILIYGLYSVGSPLIMGLPPQLVDIIMFMGNIKK